MRRDRQFNRFPLGNDVRRLAIWPRDAAGRMAAKMFCFFDQPLPMAPHRDATARRVPKMIHRGSNSGT